MDDKPNERSKLNEIERKHIEMLFDCPRETLIFGDGTVGALTSRTVWRDTGEESPSIGLLKLSEPPKDLDNVPDYMTAQYCSVLMVFKNRRSINVLRGWLNHAEEILDKIEKETK